jgi:hypothetical protein
MTRSKGKFLSAEEKLELDKKLTYQQRFEILLRLIRVSKMLVPSQPYSNHK